MTIEFESELYYQAKFWKNEVAPESLEEYCRQKFPIISIPLREDLKVMRVASFAMAVPYLKEVLSILNSNLPSVYPRFSLNQLTEEKHTLSDGREVDFKETWKGNSFLVEERGELIGVTIGRREVIITKDNEGHFTGRGYIPVVATSKHVRGTSIAALLSLPIKSLTVSGATEIRGSCAPSNALAEKLFSRFSLERWQEGDWIRYKLDPSVGDVFLDLIVKKFNLSEENTLKLILPINSQ